MRPLGKELEATLDRALALAQDRNQKFTTLEHLLLALLDDKDATKVLNACQADIGRLRSELLNYVDTQLDSIRSKDPQQSRPTAGFQRVLQRASIHVQASGRDEVTGANILLALFSERESHALHFLQLQEVRRIDLVNFLAYGLRKLPGALDD